MPVARALSGLPPYGPAAISFPRPEAFSEGFVVEFRTNAGATWVGNFAKWSEAESSIHTELGDRIVLIVAGGAGYIVDPEERVVVREIGPELHQVWFVPELDAIVISNGLWFEAFDKHRLLWRSRRLSWDGTRNVYRSGTLASGEAYTPMGDDWLPFRIDLATGDVEGGSYNGPDCSETPALRRLQPGSFRGPLSGPGSA